MPAPFDEQLAFVQEAIHRVNIVNHFEKMRDGLLYDWNRAERLRYAAKIIYDANGPREIFSLLAGLSIELLLKGIHRAFDKPIPYHHRINDLCREVGIFVGDDDRIILAALSDHVYWASRYTTPKKRLDIERTMIVLDQKYLKSRNFLHDYLHERDMSLEDYDRFWKMFDTYYRKAREARIGSDDLRF